MDYKYVLGSGVSNYSNFIKYALVASDEALHNANILNNAQPIPPLNSTTHSTNNKHQLIDKTRCGVTIGTGGLGSLQDVTYYSQQLGAKKISPYFVPKVLCNMAAGQVSIRHGLQGPLHSVATACAAGAHAIGDACKCTTAILRTCTLITQAYSSI